MDSVKRIDIHSHVTAFPQYAPDCKWQGRFCSAEEMIKIYDELNIEKGVILPLNAAEGQMTPMTSEAAKWVADKYPERFLWFCSIDPRALSNKVDCNLSPLFAHYKKLGALGVGEITCQLYADDPKLDNMFSYAEEYEMPVLIHIATKFDGGYGIVDEAGLPRIERMLKKHPRLNIIGHSQPFWAEISCDCPENERGGRPQGKVTEGRLSQLLREYPNLWCDVSAGSGANAFMRDPDFAEGFFEEFSDRILYGCDVCATLNTHQIEFDAFLKQMYADKRISHETWKKIARENAIKLLKL